MPIAMTDLLKFTGERFTPETKGEIWYEHWHRYCAVLPLARNKRVLDAACGEGYGSALLGGVASQVTGIDLSAEAIEHAKTRYTGNGRIDFVRGSAAQLPLPDACVDLVVSFETIEHVVEQEQMLAEFRRVLIPPGLLVISSPNKPIYSEERGFRNEFHVRELARDELSALLKRDFPKQSWLGQRLLFHSLIWPEAMETKPSLELLRLDNDRPVQATQPAPPMYFIVVCGGAESLLPQPLVGASLFADQDQTIYREFERTTQAERTLYRMLLERDQDVSSLREQLAESRQQLDRLLKKYPQA